MSHFFLYLFFTTAAIATNADVSSNENMEIHEWMPELTTKPLTVSESTTSGRYE